MDQIKSLGLPPIHQQPPTPGIPRPGESAFGVEALTPYFLGSQFAVTALSGRVPEARDDARRMSTEYDRLLRSVRWLKEQASD